MKTTQNAHTEADRDTDRRVVGQRSLTAHKMHIGDARVMMGVVKRCYVGHSNTTQTIKRVKEWRKGNGLNGWMADRLIGWK